MIELGKIMIKDEASIVEARNKIYFLAEDLKFDSIGATRLATITSELGRTIYQEGGKSSLGIGFDKKEEGFGFILIFESKKEALDFSRAEIFFDSLQTSPTEEGLQIARAFKYIPDSEFLPTDEFINMEKERLTRLSRAELLNEVRRKNEELIELLDELKIRAEKEKELAAAAAAAADAERESMKAFNLFSAGVAHELNNPIMGIINQIQYVQDKLPDKEPLQKALNEAVTYSRRCARIIRELISYSRIISDETLEHATGDTKSAAQMALQEAQQRMRDAGVVLTIRLHEDPLPVTVDEPLLKQVILNIIDNACDAISNSKQREIVIETKDHNDTVAIVVKDSGVGMDKSTLEHIFELFFTTKPSGFGTGMGLSLCHTIVYNAGGRIDVESTPGVGTTFTIVLPKAKE